MKSDPSPTTEAPPVKECNGMFKSLDGSMMCESHPGHEWPHDDCAGPGMPWVIEGRTSIEAAIKSSATSEAPPVKDMYLSGDRHDIDEAEGRVVAIFRDGSYLFDTKGGRRKHYSFMPSAISEAPETPQDIDARALDLATRAQAHVDFPPLPRRPLTTRSHEINRQEWEVTDNRPTKGSLV